MKPEFKIISDLIIRDSHVLDVGCGDGVLMEFLIKEGYRQSTLRGRIALDKAYDYLKIDKNDQKNLFK